jgi:SAM-dependent methyltransferase
MLGAPPQRDEAIRTLTFYSFARAELFTAEIDPALLAYWQQSLNSRIPGARELGGRFGLDAGCGEGRYTYCLAESGAEVIGLDLSEAASLAYLRNRANPRAHIVQGSIYRPPFRRGIFDFVFSTGVLHHLPDPRLGFEALVPLLHPGGSMHIWVYGLRQMSFVYRLSHLTFLRGLGNRLSPRASYLVSMPVALGLHALVFSPIRLVARFPRLRSRFSPQLRELAGLPFKMHVAEVHDRIGVPITHYLTEAEVRAWHEHAGLEQISVNATGGGRGWSARGYRPEHVAGAST